MAKIVIIKHRESGMMKEGMYGFSWTFLFFGYLVPIFRGELLFATLFFFLTYVTYFLWIFADAVFHHTYEIFVDDDIRVGLSIIPLWFWQIIFAILYNKQYMTRMFEKGWELADTDARNYEARAALNMVHNQTEADSRAGRPKSDSPTPTITS